MLVGLTGGIACGKTTVAQMLEARGATIIDADQVARDVVAPGTDGLDALVDAFGAGILNSDGTLDRKRLAATVFSDDEARRRLNGILHPRIAVESMTQISRALSGESPIVVYDAALLVETGRADDFRPLIVVTAPPMVQRSRLVARDGLTEAEAQGRLDAQMPVSEKAAVADFVITNDADLEVTEDQVTALWSQLMQARP